MSGSFEKRGSIGIIRIDNPPVNAISLAVRLAIVDGVKALNADPELKAAVLICAGRTFMAGADITEFGKPMGSPMLPEVLAVIEGSTKPIIAALHGTAFGGGLETALTCHYRVAVASAKVGLPEIKLGLLPGAGGTQRLPRLVGPATALEVILSGDPVPAKVAAAAGVIDEIIEGDLLEGAIAHAERVVAAGSAMPLVSARAIDPASLPEDFFAKAREGLAKAKRNLFAHQQIVDLVEAAVTLPFAEGIARERAAFMQCMAHPQSAALRHVFFAERAAAKVTGVDESVMPREVKSVGIIGAGTMGGGIAMNFLNVGIPVTLLEVKQEALDRGVGVIRRNYEATAAKGKLTVEQVEQRMGLLKPTLDFADLGGVDMIIEAVFETMAVKKDVFTRLDAVAKPGAILATNTSYLSIDEIAAVTSRPQDVLGTHFFSPANVMKLLEIVRGEKTAPEVLGTVMALSKRIGKVGVVCGNRDGFIGNRMLGAYGYQANRCVLEGATPQQVDAVIRKFGMPMGPFQMSDLAGLDIGYRSRKDREPGSFDERVTRSADRLVEAGRCGQKTNGGYYDYAPGDRTPQPSALVADIIEQVSAECGITRRPFTDEEILERCMLALMNEGCEVLREGVAARASDIDIVYLYGYGFPAYRGGPMHWAESEVGLPKALERLRHHAAAAGDHWLQVSPLLEELVASGKGFKDLR
ncbi:MAG: 3-hydroxyacyl-CoA dehydrogenase NAD-binding domain-containing protein [Gammaproteobacteria bacterium]